MLGDMERTRSKKIKVLFVLGMNDGKFPKANRQEGFLNDQDRNLLEKNGMELAKDSIDSVYESQFNMYRTLTLPEEKLYLSYCSSDKEGNSVRPSIMIKKIRRFFPKLEQKSDMIQKEYSVTNEQATFEEALQVYHDYLENGKIKDIWRDILLYFYQKNKKKFSRAISGMYYTNQAEKISLKSIKKMYGTTLKTTVSRLENYRRCPFSFHMTYGLKLKENEGFQMNAIDTGSFMHEVIDAFFEEIQNKNLNVKILSEEKILEIVDKIIEEILQTSKYYIFSSSAKFRLMTRRLKKVVKQSIKYIIESLRYSDFEVAGHELEFGSQNADYDAIKLQLETGENIEIIGKIDRLDVGQLNDKEYVRIIDYKSQIKKLDLNQVVAGLQIQLITYLDAVAEQKNSEQAGILYLGLVDSIVKAKKNLSEEEIEKEIRKNFKMQGLILADVNVIKMMDNQLENGYSMAVPVYVGKNGEISEKLSSVASKEEFEKLQKKVKEIIKEISQEILAGNISIKPYQYQGKTGCDYCQYKSICMFNPNIKGNDYGYVNHRNHQGILNELMEG